MTVPFLCIRYPAAAKAFYMARDPERTDLALCMDMLAPEGYGEIIGGGQRIHDLETLRQQIAAHDLPEEAFKWLCGFAALWECAPCRIWDGN